MLEIAQLLVGREDRLVVLPGDKTPEADDEILLAVADGAGGTGSGAQAAEAALAAFPGGDLAALDPAALACHLAAADARVATTGGETTCVLAVVSGGVVRGASVGDSQAWLVGDDGTVVDLTGGQRRKPLLGSGRAEAVPFGPVPLAGTLLLGSDGLFNYVPRARIVELARAADLDGVPAALVEAARLRDGSLWDDIAIIALRHEPGPGVRRQHG